ncbi:MAG: protein kinase [Planctomycetota bacterium]
MHLSKNFSLQWRLIPHPSGRPEVVIELQRHAACSSAADKQVPVLRNDDLEGNLLFGIPAMQMDFISSQDLIASTSVWMRDKSKHLGEVLIDQRALDKDSYTLLLQLVSKHLELHDNAVERSLASLEIGSTTRRSLEQIGDSELEATLAHTRSRNDIGENAPADTVSLGQDSLAGPRFRILRPYARGGLGQVSVAMDHELHREVALKEIQEKHSADKNSRARFVQEAEITGRLEHPSIVPVYGLGQYDDGRPFYAMRFIRGDSLREAIDQFHSDLARHRDRSVRNLELRNLLGRFIDVCNAVEYANSRGILHRDVKPGNIMLGKYGETLVVDWGLAKPIGKDRSHGDPDEPTLRPQSGSGSSPTQMGAAIGTPPYMSPEQASGRLDQLGVTSDVYSLGATLYCLLTGKPPFTDPDVATVLRKVQKGDFLPPRKIRSEVPVALEAICMKAMSKHHKDRYASPLVLAEDIEKWLADEPVSAWRDSLPVRVGRWAKKYRSQVAGVVAFLATAVPLLVVASLLLNEKREQIAGQKIVLEESLRSETRAKAQLSKTLNELTDANDRIKSALRRSQEETRRADEKTEVARRQEQIANRNLYVAHTSMAKNALADGRFGETVDFLNRQRGRVKATEDFRSFEWYWLWQSTHHQVRSFGERAQRFTASSFSADGSRIAVSTDDSIQVLDQRTGDLIVELDKGQIGEAFGFALSAGGSRLVLIENHSRRHSLSTWNTANGERLWAKDGKFTRNGVLIISPDGSRFASAGHGHPVGKLVCSDFESGEEVWDYDHVDPIYSLAFNPSGDKIAIGSHSIIVILDAETGKRFKSIEIKGQQIRGLAYSDDESKLAAAGDNNVVGAWDPSSGELLHSLHSSDAKSGALAFEPGGNRLICGGQNGAIQIWDLASETLLRTIGGHEGTVEQLSVTPEGTLLSFGAGIVGVWNTEAGLPIRHHEGPIKCVEIDRQGRWAATCGIDGSVKVWEIGTGKTVLHLKGAYGFSDLAFSPNENWLATAGAKTIEIWRVPDGKHIKTVGEHLRPIVDIFFDEMEAKLVSVGDDETVHIWDLENAKRLFTYEGKSVPSYVVATGPSVDRRSFPFFPNNPSVAFRPESGQFASATTDGRLTLRYTSHKSKPIDFMSSLHREFARDENGELKSNSDTLQLNCVTFNASGTLMATGSKDGRVIIWNPANGEQMSVFHGSDASVMALVFSNDGRRLFSAGQDGTVRIWDLKTSQDIFQLVGPSIPISGLAITPDDSQLVCAYRDGTVKVWESLSRRVGVTAKSVFAHEHACSGIAISADERRIATCGLDHAIKVWDSTSLSLLHVLDGHTENVVDIAFGADPVSIVSAAQDGRVTYWQLESSRRTKIYQDLRNPPTSVAFNPSRRQIVYGLADGSVGFYDLEDTSASKTIRQHESRVVDLEFTRDGRILVTAGADGDIKVWDPDRADIRLALTDRPLNEIDSDKILSENHLNNRVIVGVAFSPTGNRLAASTRGGVVKIWDSRLGKLLAEIPTGVELRARARFDGDGKHLIVPSGSEFTIYDCETFNFLDRFKLHGDNITDFVVSRENRWVASVGADNWLRIASLGGAGDAPSSSNQTETLVHVSQKRDASEMVVTNGPGNVSVVNLKLDIRQCEAWLADKSVRGEYWNDSQRVWRAESILLRSAKKLAQEKRCSEARPMFIRAIDCFQRASEIDDSNAEAEALAAAARVALIKLLRDAGETDRADAFMRDFEAGY